MGRKNLLADLVEEQLTAVNNAPEGLAAPERKPAQPTLGSRGAVGAMSRSLEMISAERDAAKALSEQIAAGQNVVEIETILIDSSIVPDRMNGADQDHIAFVESIRERGQLVPVLLRPHPERAGRFQVAYGHRRVRALGALGRPVRAIVRELSDDELVIAQGKENNDRKDLSFIERACFAATLEDRKFGRETIMAALNVDKTELSRLISVTRAIPRSVVDAIGPAPKAGRRRWMELAERLGARGAEKHLTEALQNPKFHAANSDDRFALLFAAITPRRPKPTRATTWTGEDGKKVARIERGVDRVTLSVDEKAAPSFGDFLIDRLPELYRAFQDERRGE
ncbi:chromosome partitioning protein, ParB family [Rhizobiales bacterium GAS113]|nr:chromosome partitioning protein, ParB family [Rhizobiales bacterium GAS113]